MKTKITYIGLFFLLVGVLILINIHQRDVPKDFILQNIEAIASEETGGSCRFIGSIDCPFYHDKVYKIIE